MKNLFSTFGYVLLKVLTAGLIIGYFHQHQWIVLGFFIGYLVLKSYRLSHHDSDDIKCSVIGFFVTLSIGTFAELWGTYMMHWTYHDLPPSQLIPVWLPLAWGCTHATLYGLEICLTHLTSHLKFNFLIMNICCVILSTVGEYIPIYMGVWDYHWPYQFMGVPLFASFLLACAHLGSFCLMSYFQSKNTFDNILYERYGGLLGFKMKKASSACNSI